MVSAYPGVRAERIRSTLQSKYILSFQPSLVDGATPEDSYRQSLVDIHWSAVADAIASYDPNRVLGQPPPPVSAEEKSLLRHTQTTLTQLMTGFSSTMRDHLHRIGRLPSPLCLECSEVDHTALHLFSCLARPTDQRPTDLWERPREAATFLSSLPSFAHLPALPPPPPEPPPPPAQPPPDPPAPEPPPPPDQPSPEPHPPPWHGQEA